MAKEAKNMKEKKHFFKDFKAELKKYKGKDNWNRNF